MCVLCRLSSKLSNCIRCTDEDTCIECAPGYSIDLDNKCTKCDETPYEFTTLQLGSCKLIFTGKNLIHI